ncbi:mutator type transposase [Tanacetum coccineum]|uniref:Mutator type transposase n=1 Tax=Tanacetum coccineum TaxID=301880 RepID=A0ABQ5EEM4_9ASTR
MRHEMSECNLMNSIPLLPFRCDQILGVLHQEKLQQKHELSVTQSKAFRAKQEAEKKLIGDYTLQYKMLKDYVLGLQESNPNTTVKIHVQSKQIMRDLLGLDGAFMKGPYPGQLLTAVSVDPNNGIYPLAYGLVETENTESWTWFLTQLGDDLDLYRNSNFTFVSDRQKGIIPAIANLFPNAEHRYCVKHIHENMKKKWNVFNGKLVAGRDRLVIDTLKIVNVNKLIDRCDGPLTPTATKILRSNSNEARKYIVDYAGDDLYQMRIDWLDTWKKVYSFKIKPIRGRIHWPKCNVPTTLLPPKHQPQVGCFEDSKEWSCTGPREPKSNKRKVSSKGMDDNVALVGFQSKKATTHAARSATSTDKGKRHHGFNQKKGKLPETDGVQGDSTKEENH